MSPTERLFANAVETGSARPSDMVGDPTSNMPQPQMQPGTSPEASMDYFFHNLTNCDEMVNLELVI